MNCSVGRSGRTSFRLGSLLRSVCCILVFTVYPFRVLGEGRSQVPATEDRVTLEAKQEALFNQMFRDPAKSRRDLRLCRCVQ